MGSVLRGKLIVGVIVGLLVGVILGYGSGLSRMSSLEAQVSTLQAQVASLQGQVSAKDVQITNLTAQIAALQARIPPLRKGAWNLIASFKGSSSMKTDYFYVSGPDLRINWTWTSTAPKYASFSIVLYKEGETVYTEMFPFLQDRGTTFAHNLKKAYYYLDISAGNIDEWTITVEVWIPA